MRLDASAGCAWAAHSQVRGQPLSDQGAAARGGGGSRLLVRSLPSRVVGLGSIRHEGPPPRLGLMATAPCGPRCGVLGHLDSTPKLAIYSLLTYSLSARLACGEGRARCLVAWCLRERGATRVAAPVLRWCAGWSTAPLHAGLTGSRECPALGGFAFCARLRLCGRRCADRDVNAEHSAPTGG